MFINTKLKFNNKYPVLKQKMQNSLPPNDYEEIESIFEESLSEKNLNENTYSQGHDSRDDGKKKTIFKLLSRRLFKCEFESCPRSFKERANLIIHMRTHVNKYNLIINF
jgi:hypothetical protein